MFVRKAWVHACVKPWPTKSHTSDCQPLASKLLHSQDWPNGILCTCYFAIHQPYQLSSYSCFRSDLSQLSNGGGWSRGRGVGGGVYWLCVCRFKCCYAFLVVCNMLLCPSSHCGDCPYCLCTLNCLLWMGCGVLQDSLLLLLLCVWCGVHVCVFVCVCVRRWV